jgi:hypothetical protein
MIYNTVVLEILPPEERARIIATAEANLSKRGPGDGES